MTHRPTIVLSATTFPFRLSARQDRRIQRNAERARSAGDSPIRLLDSPVEPANDEEGGIRSRCARPHTDTDHRYLITDH